MKFTNKFKEATSQLPAKEKNKLLLLKKDINLAKQLEFKLVNNLSIEEQRAKIMSEVLEDVKQMSSRSDFSSGRLFMNIRYVSGVINEHVKVTKDKFGEVVLHCAMLNQVIKRNHNKIVESTPNNARKLLVDIIARAFKISILAHKLHPDELFDVKDKLKELGKSIGDNHNLMMTAIHNGFDVNWLIKAEFPEDIVEQHKNIKKLGFLK